MGHKEVNTRKREKVMDNKEKSGIEKKYKEKSKKKMKKIKHSW